MKEDQRYSIGEIAQLFNVPASTIRYWEEKGIFSSKRNNENDYREFDIQGIIELIDIVFYRNLNVPIQKMKQFNHLSPSEIYQILTDTEAQVQLELTTLQQKLSGISSRKDQLDSLFSLKEEKYQQETVSIEKIVTFEMDNPQDIQVQLAGPTNFIVYSDNPNESDFDMGLGVSYSYSTNNQELWRQADHTEATYVTCLLEDHSENMEQHNYLEHKEALYQKGLGVVRIIAAYLATASDEEDTPVDFYKAWLEVIPLQETY